MMWSVRRILAIGLIVFAALAPPSAPCPSVAAQPLPPAADRPAIIGAAPENEADVIRLADGTLKVFFNQRDEYVGSLSSSDGGATWSQPRREFDVSGTTAHAIQVLRDRRGQLHVFYLVIEGSGRKLNVDRFLDIWQCTTTGDGARWTGPRRIYHGAVGALRGIVQTDAGRIVLPFSTAAPRRLPGPPTGSFYTTAIYSDDDGRSWRETAVELTSPCTEGYNGGNYGAVEPTIVQLVDGRLWMLIRTQTGRLYESFSTDGADWSPAAPSRFYSSNSPAMLRRLDDGRLLLAWNNAQVPPRHQGQGVYGGRDALHAALSDDDGRTWRGFREVYRDPTRHRSSELRNDRGTAYPDAVDAGQGTIVLVTGQGRGRRAILRFSPEWLLDTHHEDDFSAGLDGWTAFDEIGPAERFWRARRPGGQIVPHPDDNSRRVLSVGRRDDEPGAGAVWNFPSGRRGTLTLSCRTTADFGGTVLALTDRLFHPADDAAIQESLFALGLSATSGDGLLALRPAQWQQVRLSWDVDRGTCTARAGEQTASLPLRGAATLGACYLVIRSTAAAADPSGLLVERVAVDVEP